MVVAGGWHEEILLILELVYKEEGQSDKSEPQKPTLIKGHEKYVHF